MKWLLILLEDSDVIDKAVVLHESEEQAKEDLIEQFDYLFNEFREREGEREDDIEQIDTDTED